MPQIRANRGSVDDRFNVLGFTIRTESPLFEVGLATDPALFKVENRNRRKRNNFYSSRVGGAIRAQRGEAVYLVPPQVLSNFIGNPRLYFGLATFPENSQNRPDFVQNPNNGNMYVNTSGLSERGLRRLINGTTPPVYGTNGSAIIEWGGDALTASNHPSNVATPAVPVNNAIPPTNDSVYDDGFGPLPPATNHTATQQPALRADRIDPASNPTNGGQPTNTVASSESLQHHPATQYATRPFELIRPFYDPADPASALMCQNNAFSLEREEWFAGVPNTTIFPHSAICQLEMTNASGSTYQGTGFYIGTNRILTCAHNLSGMSSVKIIPGRNGASSKPYNEVSVSSSSWRIAPGYTGTGDWNNDLAVIDNVPLAAPNGQYFEFLNMTPSDQLPIVVCGYSAGSRTVPALNEIIDGDKQHLHGGYVRSQSNPEVIEYPILTLMGASGSPVYHLSSASGQLKAMITAVHVTGQPAASGLNRGCFITPSKIDWIEGRTTSFALGNGGFHAQSMNAGFSVHWDSVQYQPQSSTMSCWAASAAMVVGWRDQMSIPDNEIAAMIPIIDAYRNGLWPRQRQVLADVWNLVAEPPASYTIEAWRDMLQSYGPMYIDMTASGTVGGHVRVLVGMESGGAADGSDTTMYMYDPSPGTQGKIKLTFSEFLVMYEARTDNSGGHLEYQILHSAGVPAGYQPVTSAPFSMDGTVQSDQASQQLILAPAPEPLLQQQLSTTAPQTMGAGTVAIASVIAGAVMERVTNNQGDIRWELDQLRGLKHPNDTAPSPMPPAHDGSVIRLTSWPYVENLAGDQISAGFEINWQYNGKSVGNVMISNVATNDAVGWGLIIKAKIMDDNIVYPRSNPEFAAMRVRLEYRFTRFIGSDSIAIRDIHLFGNGRYNMTGRWEQ